MWVLSVQNTVCNLFLIGLPVFEMRIGQTTSYGRYKLTNLERTLTSLQVSPNSFGESIWTCISTYSNEFELSLSVTLPITL